MDGWVVVSCILITRKGNVGKGGAQVNRAATRSQSREGKRERIIVQYLCPFSLKRMKPSSQRTVRSIASYLRGLNILARLPVAVPLYVRIKSIPISNRWVPPRCRLLIILLPVHTTDKTRRRMIRAPIIVIPARTGMCTRGQ